MSVQKLTVNDRSAVSEQPSLISLLWLTIFARQVTADPCAVGHSREWHGRKG